MNTIHNPYEALFRKMEQLENLLIQSMAQGQPADDEILTKKEAADYLKCSVQTVTNLVKSGQLSPSNVGRNLKFRKSELDAFLELNK